MWSYIRKMVIFSLCDDYTIHWDGEVVRSSQLCVTQQFVRFSSLVLSQRVGFVSLFTFSAIRVANALLCFVIVSAARIMVVTSASHIFVLFFNSYYRFQCCISRFGKDGDVSKVVHFVPSTVFNWGTVHVYSIVFLYCAKTKYLGVSLKRILCNERVSQVGQKACWNVAHKLRSVL
jgi:hypothetical protein